MPDHATSSDPAVQAQLNRFAQLSPGRDILGLERIAALMAALGNPHHSLPPVFHVAGTNGKGSTCAFLRAVLEAAVKTVHVYTSPHLVRFNERIRLAGTLIEDDALAPLLAEILDAAEAQDIGPSFFEATTAAAFLAFSRTPADYCVIEVGLGGRLDATNIIERPLVCGIAQVGIDHQAFLGDTLAEIAGEKAGIAKAGVPLVCLAQEPDAVSAIERVASETGAPLRLEGRDWQIETSLMPAMLGAHQMRNANLAVQMLKSAVLSLSKDGSHEPSFDRLRTAATAGLERAVWPGRLQKLAPGPLTRSQEVWIDGAHNPAAAQALAIELADAPKHLILGILANKDAEGIIAPLAPHALSLTFVDVPGHASHDAQALATRWSAQSAPDLVSALAMVHAEARRRGDARPLRVSAPPREPILIVGSLYLAGEALRLNDEVPA